MRAFSIALSLLACGCAGCLSSRAPETNVWTVDSQTGGPMPVAAEGAGVPAFGTTRMGVVAVDAPYDKPPFVVRRGDGSVAFDHYNLFAASPASLLRAPIRTRLAADGRFGCVVPPSSVATADSQVEVQVTDLSLDCRAEGRRVARAAVTLDVVKTGRGPRVVSLEGSGSGEADAADGNYTKAFSVAFDAAVSDALKALKTVENAAPPKSGK